MMTRFPEHTDRVGVEPVRRAEALLAAAGLQPTRVERCPDPGCPRCARAGRVAA